jgi:hypothetical protein
MRDNSASFPEPTSFNGGPDEGRAPASGRRREMPARCYCCGEDIEDRSVLFDGHEFCGRECMDTWVRR